MGDKHVDTFSEFRLITSALLILLTITGALGSITEVPKNNFVLKGATAEFTCCSNIPDKPFFWKVKYIGSQSIKDIYDTGLVNGFGKSDRFYVTVGSRSGCYRLSIKDVEIEDIGTYFCVDEEGLGQQLRWELVILESFDCEEKNRKAVYTGENNFGLPEDVISALCVTKYLGNIPPKPICERTSGTKIFDNHQHATATNLTATLSIQMPARKAFNGEQLCCRLKIDGDAGDNQAITAWNSSPLKINYASFHQRGVSQCSVDDLFLDCQPPCSYKTIRSSNGSSYCEITNPSMTNQSVHVLLQDNNVPETQSNVENQAHPAVTLTVVTTALVSVFIGCALAGATAFAIIILQRKKRRRQHNGNKLDSGSNRDTPADAEFFMVRSNLFHQPTTPSTPGNMNTMGAGSASAWKDSGVIGTNDDLPTHVWQNTSLGPVPVKVDYTPHLDKINPEISLEVGACSKKETTNKKLDPLLVIKTL